MAGGLTARLERATPWRVAAVGLLAEVFVLVRVWQAVTGAAIWWNDSFDYRAVAQHGWSSVDLWAGARPPVLPVLWKAVGSAERTVLVQTLVACACWLLVAWAIASLARPGWTRVAAFALVLGLATTRPIAQWDRSALTESLALGAAAALLAALVWAVQRRSWPSVVAVVGVAAAFAAVRDTHVVVVVVLAGTASIAAVVGQRRDAQRVAVCAVGLWLVASAAFAAAGRTERSMIPLANVMATRVFPYPDRLEWFVRHGMPQADDIVEIDAVEVPGLGVRSRWVDPREPRFDAYRAWLVEDGRSTYVRWLVEHPGDVLREPFLRPERATNNAHGNLGFYAATDRVDVPFVTAVLFPSWAWLTPITVLVLVVGMWRGLWRAPVWWVLVGTVALGLLHMLVAWHADAVEVTRHALVGNVQVRLGLLALAVAVAFGRRHALESARVHSAERRLSPRATSAHHSRS